MVHKNSIIERIREVAKQSDNPSDILTSQIDSSEPEEKLLSLISNSTEMNVDISIGALTIGDLIYDTMRLDPEVIKAIDFARTEDIGNMFSFSVYADSLKESPDASYTGHISNIKGYVGERFVAQELQSQGMEVEFPKDPNQEGFDLLVNGDPWQVKCVANKSNVLEHLEKNPNIPVFVNEEVADSLVGVSNVYPVDGFTLESVETSTRETIESGDEMLDFEIPLIAISVALGKNAYLILNGKTDKKHGAINIAYDVAGGVAGGEIGATSIAYCGSVLGPYGVVVGGLVGAIGGSMYGRRILKRVKEVVHTRREVELAEKALKDFVIQSYESSKKSQEIFEKKVNLLVDNIHEKGKNLNFLDKYVQKRIKNDRKYLKDKVQQLSKSRKNPRLLDPQTEDILIAGINAVTLSLRAKVHPQSIKSSMDNLMDSLETLQEKRSKLW